MAPQQTAWSEHNLDETKKALSTDFLRGLTSEEVKSRQKLQGENELTKEKELGVIGRILKQFKSPLVFILLGAGIVTLFLREFIDATVIFAALFINVAMGTAQEERASRAFEKLSLSQEHFATVLRNGRKVVIPSVELVTGDVVEIEAGSYVSADLRIISSTDLSINESVLTGEWASVPKEEGVLEKKAPIAEQGNMAWMGTLVSSGIGMGVVVAIGNRTQVGAIASELGGVSDTGTPLQESIRRVARFLIYIIGVSISVIFILGFLRGEPLGEMLLIAIALAVATMPEGLPAAVTIVLALGMESILKKGGLVKNLLAAETLGATTIILTDKTGTLTEAKMKLSAVYTHSSLRRKEEDEWTKDDRALMTASILASDAFVEETSAKEGEEQKMVVHGRPIERAILLAGIDAGISQKDLGAAYARKDFLQFTSKRRFGVSLNLNPEHKRKRLYLTGSPEFLLGHADNVLVDGVAVTLDKETRSSFQKVQEARSAEGMRFIGVAYKDVVWDTVPKGDVEHDSTPVLLERIVFIGFLSFSDPIREDVKSAVAEVEGAGARVVMVTGDNPKTAFNIATQVGIAKGGDEVIIGSELSDFSDEELYEKLRHVDVFARTLPDQKLRIARVLKNRGEVVAMTGDGINDAPALRSANIGIAVGSGTEVAKEAADMVLINNSFSIIVSAIKEGRKIIDNLRKIIAYLLSTSFSEIIIIGAALFAGAPLPLLPAQILWANIIEEGMMSFPLAFEGPEKGIMKRDPRAHNARKIITGRLRTLIFLVSMVTGALLVALYFWLLRQNLPIEEVRTIMFVALSLDAMFFVFSLKSLDKPVWKLNPFDNLFLVAAFGGSLALLIIAITFPPLRFLLSLTTLTSFEVLLLAGVGLFNLATIEVAKYFIFERSKLVASAA